MRQRRRSSRCACALPAAAGKCAVHRCRRPLGCAVRAVAPCTRHASHRHSVAGCWEPVRVWWSVVWSIYLGELVGPTLSWAERRKGGRARLFLRFWHPKMQISVDRLLGSARRRNRSRHRSPNSLKAETETETETEQPNNRYFGSVRFTVFG